MPNSGAKRLKKQYGLESSAAGIDPLTNYFVMEKKNK
jgi:hypothetical protein